MKAPGRTTFCFGRGFNDGLAICGETCNNVKEHGKRNNMNCMNWKWHGALKKFYIRTGGWILPKCLHSKARIAYTNKSQIHNTTHAHRSGESKLFLEFPEHRNRAPQSFKFSLQLVSVSGHRYSVWKVFERVLITWDWCLLGLVSMLQNSSK